MAYQVEQINDLEQFGILTTTFVLIDDKGIMPEQRIDKVFTLNDNMSKIINNEKTMVALFYENEYLKNSGGDGNSI